MLASRKTPVTCVTIKQIKETINHKTSKNSVKSDFVQYALYSKELLLCLSYSLSLSSINAQNLTREYDHA